jgi:hypothetical protein
MPWVVVGAAVSFASTPTSSIPESDAARTRLTALDFRGSVAMGKLLLDAVSPYVSVRAFGGPAFWKRNGNNVIGGDLYHFQLGVGMLATTGRVDGFFEVMPVGERSASFGFAVSF